MKPAGFIRRIDFGVKRQVLHLPQQSCWMSDPDHPNVGVLSKPLHKVVHCNV
jgi:hypothetical protein